MLRKRRQRFINNQFSKITVGRSSWGLGAMPVNTPGLGSTEILDDRFEYHIVFLGWCLENLARKEFEIFDLIHEGL